MTSGSVHLDGPVIAAFTQQLSHYHVARYRAAAQALPRLTVISSMNDADFPEFLSRDISNVDIVRLFDGKSAYLRAIRSGEMWHASYAALEKIRPEVVAVAGWSFAETFGAICWARRNGAHVVMMSETQQRDGPRSRPREAIKSRVVAACDAALVGGSRQEHYIVDLGIPPARVYYGYDVVDNQHFALGAEQARGAAPSFRARHHLPERYILASARFVAKKNLIRLVEAFTRAIKLTQAPHSLVILGDGPDRGLIESSISNLGVTDRVLLPGFKDYETLPVIYGLADAFVHVSLTEQWGLVINEAAAAGLPFIVSNPCGAAAELVVEGMNGYLVEPTNLDEIARALGTVMSATDEVRRAMGAESKRLVAHWGPDRFSQGLHSAVNAAMAAPKRALRIWDAALFRVLSRQFIAKVS